jgi:hypothetical protein
MFVPVKRKVEMSREAGVNSRQESGQRKNANDQSR